MKVSLSIPSVDVEFLDSYAREHRIESRSAAVQRAIALLRAAELGDDYELVLCLAASTGPSRVVTGGPGD